MGVTSLVAAMTLAASAVCSSASSGAGSDEEVSVRLVRWSEDDSAWLEQELARWISEQDRKLCTPRTSSSEDMGLTIESNELEAVITFVFQNQRRTRSVPRASESSLYRYQVAVAAEELVRSTWEAPPPPRFAILGRGDFSFLGGGGQFLGGGSLGAGLFLLPSVCVELMASLAGLGAPTLTSGGTVSGLELSGSLAATWLPIAISVFRAGPRGSFTLGALSVRVREAGSTDANGLAPWLVARGGLAVGIETRKLLALAVLEAGYALSGAAVDVEGVRTQTTRGFVAHAGLQVGWLW